MVDENERIIYIIDVNVDTFMWLRYADKDLPKDNLRKRYSKMI